MKKVTFILVLAILLSSSLVIAFENPFSMSKFYDTSSPQHILRRDVLLESILFEWHHFGEEWIVDEKYEMVYSDEGILESFTIYSDEMIEDEIVLVPEMRWLFDSPVDNEMTHYIAEIYMEEERNWLEFISVTNFFSDGNIYFSEAYVRNLEAEEEEWVPFADFYYHYDENGIVEALEQIYYQNMRDREDIYGGELVLIDYDDQGRMSVLNFMEIADIIEENIIWENMRRTDFQYHEEDNTNYDNVQEFVNHFIFHMITENIFWDKPLFEIETESNWIADDELWMGYWRDITVYDQAMRIDHIVNLHVVEEDWAIDSRELYSYADNGLLTNVYDQWYDNENDVFHTQGRATLTYIGEVNAEEVLKTPSILTVKNYPNPFNPETTISFSINNMQEVKLDVFNIKGQLVKTLCNDVLDSGNHNIVWNGIDEDGRNVASGVYFYQLQSQEGIVKGKMLLLK